MPAICFRSLKWFSSFSITDGIILQQLTATINIIAYDQTSSSCNHLNTHMPHPP